MTGASFKMYPPVLRRDKSHHCAFPAGNDGFLVGLQGFSYFLLKKAFIGTIVASSAILYVCLQSDTGVKHMTIRDMQIYKYKKFILNGDLSFFSSSL